MEKSNLELLKQAINEGLSNKLELIASSCADEIVCSEKHNIVMRTIIYGKIKKHRKLSPKARQIIAILIAAALILTGCGIIFRDELRAVFKEFGVTIAPSEKDYTSQLIEEIYELSYIPEGYHLDSSSISDTEVGYIYYNDNEDILTFYQNPINGTVYDYDTEHSTTNTIVIDNIIVYNTKATKRDYYLWADDKYIYEISTSERFSVEEVEKIINGLVCK